MEAQWGGGIGSVSKIILVVRIQFFEAVGLRSHFLAGCELKVTVNPIDLLHFYSIALPVKPVTESELPFSNQLEKTLILMDSMVRSD